ncbi:hypothetical protein ACHAQA_010024 [Verticillium albo-atrum]
MGLASPVFVYHQMRVRGLQRPVIISVIFGAVATFVYILLQASAPWNLSSSHSRPAKEYRIPVSQIEGVADAIADLWRPLVVDINADNYTAWLWGDHGTPYTMPAKAKRHYTKPLGKNVLILDVDTRPLPQMQTKGRGHGNFRSLFDDDQLTPRFAGMLNHYVYAQIHGYDYKFVHASELSDRHQTWVKVPAIKEALKKYKFVVFADSDALFNQPDVPLEWMLNYWNVHPKTLVAMAEDPNSPTNQDPKGWVLWNTGFVVAQQSERTQELFRQWDDCPSGRQFPDCKRWAYDWAHEQAAFSHHLRYAWNKTDELRAIACMDANGAHHCGDRKCLGVFVSHHWGKKDEPIQDLWRLVTRAVTRYNRQDRPDLIFKAFMNPIRPLPNWAFYDEMLKFDEA